MSDERIKFLIDNLQEGLDVEVKNWLSGLSTNDERAKLAKEIIALANNGGGFIFIGFEDEGEGHPEIEPQPGELEAFTQDNISAIVTKYTNPPCQCRVGLYSRAGSAIKHPVITVPGNHRTPVWAASASPDQQTLKIATVYVRRPGGSSEPARTQDDWERLLERLLRARQTEQLDAIREILNPSRELTKPVTSLTEWHDTSLEKWRTLVAPLPDADARKLESGFWTFSFEITPFNEPALRDLNEFLQQGTRPYSGWPPFTYIHRDPLRPKAHGDNVEAWLANDHRPDQLITNDPHCDFWRLSKSGKGFLLRPMQEDRPGYLEGRSPKPEGKFFDWTLPIYRTVELLKFIENMAIQFADTNSEYSLKIQYHGMQGRTLQQHSWKYNLYEGARCVQSILTSQKSGQVYEIQQNLEEAVFQILSPIYEQFDFTKLPMVLVNNVTREALSF